MSTRDLTLLGLGSAAAWAVVAAWAGIQRATRAHHRRTT